MNTTIIYHDQCHDGITALWAALQAIPDATPYPATYSTRPNLEALCGQHVVFVDFCWAPEVMRSIATVAAGMLVLDHHKSSAEAMRAAVVDGEPHILEMDRLTLSRHAENVYQDRCENANINGAVIYCVFDMNRSGAGLAWDVLVGGPRPTLIDYVEDRDLWRFELPCSREIHAWCGSYPLDLATRDTLIRRLDLEIDENLKSPETIPCVLEGRAVLRFHAQLCADAAKMALREVIGGHDVPSVSLPMLALGSDVGHILCKGEPFAAYWMDRPDGSRYYGLRSSDDGLDVSAIAKLYGGGGHRNAAGFTKRP